MKNCYFFVDTFVRRETAAKEGIIPRLTLEDKPRAKFDYLSQAQAYVHEELQKLVQVKAQQYVAIGDAAFCESMAIEGVAETQFTCEDGVVVWRIRFCDEKGNILVPVRLSYTDPEYMAQKYTLPENGIEVMCDPSCDLPYMAYPVAEQEKDKPETFRSFLEADAGKTAKESTAYALIRDPNAEIMASIGENDVISYSMRMKNMNHPYFRQTDDGMIEVEGDDSVEATVEVDFVFDDLIVPVLKRFPITKEEPMTMADIMLDVIQSVSTSWRRLDDFFQGTPARSGEVENGFKLLGCTAGGLTVEVLVTDTEESRKYVRQALTTIKLVAMEVWGPGAEPPIPLV